jgi:transcriptional regulator with XRE-family HTH domain
MALTAFDAPLTPSGAVVRADRKDCTMSTNTNTGTGTVAEIVASALEALTADATVTVQSALGLSALPADDGAGEVERATEALKKAREANVTFAAIRDAGVGLAYATGRVGKGRMYAGQRELAKALGMTQGRVSQILKAQKARETVKARKTALRAAAASGGLDTKTAGLASTIHALAMDGTPDEIKATVVALEAGRIPTGPARTLDTDALIKACERVLVMSGECIDVTADRDAIERAMKMLTTARANLSHAIRTSVGQREQGADIG